MRVRFWFALACVVVFAAGCDVRVGENGVSVDVAGGKARDEWTRSYSVATGGTVEVTNINGAIVVEAATGDRVEVTAVRQTRAPSDEEAQDLLKKLEITEAASPSAVTLQTVIPNGTLFGRRSATVEYHLKVPAGLHVTVKTENGGVGLHDLQGTIAASTTNGGIRGTNLSGSLSAHIINGGIVADLVRVTGPIELEAVNGGIRVDVPADVKADFESHAVNGGVSIDDKLAIAGGDRSRNRISGTLNGGGTRISASTVNGGVRIRLRDGSAGTRTDGEAFDEAGPVVVQRQ